MGKSVRASCDLLEERKLEKHKTHTSLSMEKNNRGATDHLLSYNFHKRHDNNQARHGALIKYEAFYVEIE